MSRNALPAAEHFVHQADALEQLGPIDVGNHAHAGDDVAHRDDAGALPLVLVVHDRISRRSLRGEMLVEPRQRRGDPGILIAQAVHELDGECFGQSRAFTLGEHDRRRFGRVSARAQQPVGESVRLLPRGAAVHDQFGEPSQVFDQHDPERDGDRPEFADGQRLHLLVGAHEAAQQLGIEVAIGVCDEGPGHAEHPRISHERTVDQFRQLPIVAGRQCRADLTNLALDEVVVIDQPFGRRRDGAALVDRFGDHAIGVEQDSAIVGEPARQWMTLGRPWRNCLRDRKASRVLFETFGAEQFFANRFPTDPGRGGRCATEDKASE